MKIRNAIQKSINIKRWNLQHLSKLPDSLKSIISHANTCSIFLFLLYWKLANSEWLYPFSCDCDIHTYIFIPFIIYQILVNFNLFIFWDIIWIDKTDDIMRTILREEFKGIVYLLKHFIVTGVWTWFWDLWQYFPAMPISTAISIILEKNYCKHFSLSWEQWTYIDGVASQFHFKNFP